MCEFAKNALKRMKEMFDQAIGIGSDRPTVWAKEDAEYERLRSKALEDYTPPESLTAVQQALKEKCDEIAVLETAVREAQKVFAHMLPQKTGRVWVSFAPMKDWMRKYGESTERRSVDE